MTVSVLLCTYNRPALLARALHALAACNPPPDELVLVNGGDERAAEVARAWARGPVSLRLLSTANRSLAASRNVGLPHCMGEIVALTDDDAEVLPDWVAAQRGAFERYAGVGAVGGPVLGRHSNARLLSRLSDAVTFPRWPDTRPVRTLPGVNIAYRRAVIERVGAFDEQLFRGEDVDYNWRVRQAGYEVVYDPAMRVYHEHRSTWRAFFRQHWMYGRAYWLVRRKWPAMHSVYPRGLREPRDLLKAGYFVAGAFVEPLHSLQALPSGRDRLLGYGPLLINQVVWRAGMLYQALRRSTR
jgi:GT2 family glycosyltransferase